MTSVSTLSQLTMRLLPPPPPPPLLLLLLLVLNLILLRVLVTDDSDIIATNATLRVLLITTPIKYWY